MPGQDKSSTALSYRYGVCGLLIINFLSFSQHVTTILAAAEVTVGDVPQTDMLADVHMLFLPPQQFFS